MAKKTFYFPHDANARNDEKILAVRMKHGMEGYGIYFSIIEKLLESTQYTLLKDYNTIAFELRVSAEKVKSIVTDFQLFQFTECNKYFYTPSLNKRMDPLEETREKRREAGRKGAEKRWQNIANATPADDRVNKSKVNKSSSSSSSSTPLPSAEGILLREQAFEQALQAHAHNYDADTIRRFYNYWSEQNRSNTKMKFELEKTWNLQRRLATWHERESLYTNKHNDKTKPQSPTVVD